MPKKRVKIKNIIISISLIVIMIFSIFSVMIVAEAKISPTTQVLELYYENELMKMAYLLYVPETLDETEASRLVLFLHGAGDRGIDHNQLFNMDYGFLETIISNEDYIDNTVILIPQCPEPYLWVENSWASGAYSTRDDPSPAILTVKELLDQIIATYNIDVNRIYASGVSMGGMGVWELLSHYPNFFAAAAPICGCLDETKIDQYMQTPIFTANDPRDTIINAQPTINVAKILKERGADVVYKEYNTDIRNDGTYHSTWIDAYQLDKSHDNIYDFLFSHEKSLYDISAANVDIVGDYIYNGKITTPEFSIKMVEENLILNKDYIVRSFRKIDEPKESIPIDAGLYIAKIEGLGKYSGTKDVEFKIDKAKITINADNITKRIGQSEPELTYTYTGTLIGQDAFIGKLTREAGEIVGKYNILQGDLKLNDNYELAYVGAVFEILDKSPQTIVLDDIDAKKYGDASFKVLVTADTTSKLDVFTYESDNENVATVDAEGNVTIVGIGKANITVKQAGNEEYLAASVSKELVVNKKGITLTDIDLVNKTATFEGVIESDTTNVAIDFEKIDTLVNLETRKAVVFNFVLTGDKSGNYTLTTDEMEKDVVISAGTITAPENVIITVQKAEGTKTVIVEAMDVSALPEETEKVELDMTGNGFVDTVSVPKTAFTDLKNKADLEIKLTDGIVKLNKLALTAIEDAASGDNVSLKVVKLSDEQLRDEQVTQKNKLTNPVVFGFILSGVTDSLFDGGQATATVSYEKNGLGNVKVKHLKDDGATETVPATYDETNKKVTMTLAHFSDYVVYTEPRNYPISSGGGGGGGVLSYTVKFETNGAKTIKSQSVNKNGVVAEPTVPIKEGFEFDGWYTDKKLTTEYDFTNKVTKSFTLYAKWIKEKEDEEEKEKPAEPDVVEKELFGDVNKNDWFYSSVEYAVENKLMNGVSEKQFAPNDTLTRAMLVTILYRNEGEPSVNKSIPFADVEAGSYYENAVIWAQQNGIVNGVTENEFAPDANITREQIAAIMFRYVQYKAMDAVTLEENLHFADSSEISEYAVSAMNWAVSTGLMKGKSATTINPKDNATRAEIAAILQRFIEVNE